MDVKTVSYKALYKYYYIISYLLTCIDIKYFYFIERNSEITWKVPGVEEVIDK